MSTRTYYHIFDIHGESEMDMAIYNENDQKYTKLQNFSIMAQRLQSLILFIQ